jgi:hypothetical protein
MVAPSKHDKDQSAHGRHFPDQDRRKAGRERQPKATKHPWCTHPNPEQPHLCTGHPDSARLGCKVPCCMGPHAQWCEGHEKFATELADYEATGAAKMARQHYHTANIDYVYPGERAGNSEDCFRHSRQDVKPQFNWTPRVRASSAASASSSDSGQQPAKKAKNLISGATGGKAASRAEQTSSAAAPQVFGPPPVAPESVWVPLTPQPAPAVVDYNAVYSAAYASAYNQQRLLNTPLAPATELFAPKAPAVSYEQRRQAAIDEDIRLEREQEMLAADVERARQERRALAIANSALQRHQREQSANQTVGEALVEALSNPVAPSSFPDDIDLLSASGGDMSICQSSSLAEQEGNLLSEDDTKMES